MLQKRAKLKKHIIEKIALIKDKYKDQFAQLQFDLNDENKNFEKLYLESDISAKKVLNESRESIRKFPCKKIQILK